MLHMLLFVLFLAVLHHMYSTACNQLRMAQSPPLISISPVQPFKVLTMRKSTSTVLLLMLLVQAHMQVASLGQV